MNAEYYYANPHLSDYYKSLPNPVKYKIEKAGVQLATLGELKQCAERIKEQLNLHSVSTDQAIG